MGKIVLIEVSPDGFVNGLKKEELQKMLDDAYNAGVAEGKERINVTYVPGTAPLNVPNTPNDNWWYRQVTCDTSADPTKINVSKTGTITGGSNDNIQYTTDKIDKTYIMPSGLSAESNDSYIPKHGGKVY